MSPKPLKPILYAQVKTEADRIFLTSSAYKSGWIVKTYKDRGGTYEDKPLTKSKTKTGLTRWFEEKWVDLTRKNTHGTYADCGRPKATLRGTYPLCRPSVHVNSQSPKTPKELTKTAIAQAKKEKQQIKQKGNIRF